MRKHVFALLSIVLLLAISVMAISCVPKTAAPAASTDGMALKSDVKVVQDAITAQSTRIDNIAGKSGVSSQDVQNTVNSSLGNYYTKAEIDQKIADAIKKHKEETITTAATTPSGTSSASGQYTITLDHNQIISMFTETGNKDVSVTIVNNGAAAVPSLLISLRPLSPSTFAVGELQPHPNRDMKSTLSGFVDYQEGVVQTNPDAISLLQKLYWISPEIALSSGGSKTIWLNFQVKTTNVVTWTLEIKAL